VIDGDAVIHELVLPAPPGQVFDMFTDPRQLVRWIGISADLQPRPGGRVRFEVAPGQFCEGQYVIIDRPVRLVFTLGLDRPGLRAGAGTSRVQVTLARVGEDGQQTRLRLIHTGLAGDLGLLHDDGWTRFLARLARLASVTVGGEPPAYPAEQPAGRLITFRGQRARKDSP
jgi:uncharacterized protein YndB with AHSA1/START domain